jgi:hypothetical protein
MTIKVHGQIRYIGKDNVVDGESGSHKFRLLVLETLENSYIAIHAWNENIDKIKSLKLKQIVELDCRLESHRNRKNKDLWYHKLLLA